jgi:hypothetical protein
MEVAAGHVLIYLRFPLGSERTREAPSAGVRSSDRPSRLGHTAQISRPPPIPLTTGICALAHTERQSAFASSWRVLLAARCCGQSPLSWVIVAFRLVRPYPVAPRSYSRWHFVFRLLSPATGAKVDYPRHVGAGAAEPVVNIGPICPILTKGFLLAGSGAMQRVLKASTKGSQTLRLECAEQRAVQEG